MFKRILVGSDGSGTAAAAVAHAVELAQKTGAELLVASAYPEAKGGTGSVFEPEHAIGLQVATGVLEDVEKRHGDSVSLRTVMREGSPADVLLDIAEDEKVDLIIVGNRGMTGAKRIVLGSVPNAISHHAPCNVLIVHTTDE